jgi:hypothetical protein
MVYLAALRQIGTGISDMVIFDLDQRLFCSASINFVPVLNDMERGSI